MFYQCQRFKVVYLNVGLVLVIYVIVMGNFYAYLEIRNFCNIDPLFHKQKHCDNKDNINTYNNTIFNEIKNWSPSLNAPLVTVICNKANTGFYQRGDPEYSSFIRQLEQFRVMIGTLLYFSKSAKWRIVVITDSQKTYQMLVKRLRKWPPDQLQRLQFENQNISIPKNIGYSDLLQNYRPCAWQKLFLDHVLPTEDAVVFVDSDILFTGPAEDLWNVFYKFNETQAIAMGPESWYARDHNRPYAGIVGLNTGVMVMNLTKLKQTFSKNISFGHRVAEEIGKDQYPRHDQDMVNQFLHNRTHLLYELTYKWNFILSDCSAFAPNCSDCLADGISIVHGTEATFYRTAEGKILALYTTMERLTRELRTPPDILLLILLGHLEGSTIFSLPTLCLDFDSFVPMVTHHLKKVVDNYNSSKKIDVAKYIYI